MAATVSALSNGRVEVVYPSTETARSGEKIIKFRAFDQNIRLKLVPAGDVIANDFVMLNGENERIDHWMDIKSLKRKLFKDKRMGASLYIDEEVPLTVNGIINSQLKIEPYQSGKLNIDGTVAHCISEIFRSENDHVNERFIQPVFKDSRRQDLAVDECVKIKIAFILESKFTESFDNDSDLTQYLFNTINKIQILYDSLDLDIKVVLIGVIKLTKENETTVAPYIKQSLLPDYPEYFDVEKLANKMTSYYCGRKIPILKQSDLTMLISGRRFGKEHDFILEPDESLGYSFFGSLCLLCRKYGIVQERFKSYLSALTIAQEIAHLFGCVDDGQGPSEWIPFDSGAKACPPSNLHIMGNTNKNLSATFSECSKRTMKLIITMKISTCIIEKCPVDCSRCNHCKLKN